MKQSEFVKLFEEFCIKNGVQLKSIYCISELQQIGSAIPEVSEYEIKVMK